MSADIEFRLALISEAGQLAVMSRELVEQGLGWSWTTPRIIRHIRAPDSTVLVARRAGRIVGFAIMRFGEDEAHLDLLAVKADSQRKGIGRQLMGWLEETALVAGISIIRLEVRASNEAARRFYGGLGYLCVRQIRGYYSRHEPAICMAVDLWTARRNTIT